MLTQQLSSTQQQLVATQHQLLYVSSKAAAASNGGGGGGAAAAAADVRSAESMSALRAEAMHRPVNEWSAGAVIYWVERVFTAEHKSAQTSEFVNELRVRALGASSEVVTGYRLVAFKLKDFRLHTLTDLESVELITESIDSLNRSRAERWWRRWWRIDCVIMTGSPT